MSSSSSSLCLPSIRGVFQCKDETDQYELQCSISTGSESELLFALVKQLEEARQYSDKYLTHKLNEIRAKAGLPINNTNSNRKRQHFTADESDQDSEEKSAEEDKNLEEAKNNQDSNNKSIKHKHEEITSKLDEDQINKKIKADSVQ
jgi:uncharacterized FlaG/YvyC family protein